MGIRGSLPCSILNFLTDRVIQVRIGTELSSPKIIENGVPQGSVLSVTLFLIAVNSIQSFIPYPVQYRMFADDLSISLEADDVKYAINTLQIAVNSVQKLASSIGFRLSESKTFIINFSRKHNRSKPSIFLKNVPIPYKTYSKILGITFDDKLAWTNHVLELKANCIRSMNILKYLNNRNLGLNQNKLLAIYHSLIRSRLDYGCQIYNSASSSLLKNLDTVHNACLRICSGAFRTSPSHSVYSITGEPPLKFRRLILTSNFVIQCRYNPTSPTFHSLHSKSAKKVFCYQTKTKTKFHLTQYKLKKFTNFFKDTNTSFSSI